MEMTRQDHCNLWIELDDGHATNIAHGSFLECISCIARELQSDVREVTSFCIEDVYGYELLYHEVDHG